MTPQDVLRKENAKLQARIEVLEAEVKHLQGELRSDLEKDLLLRLRARWPMEPGAARLLGFLYQQRGKVLHPERLVQLMYGDRDGPVTTLFSVYVMRLRRMMGEDAIHTVARQGYRLGPRGVALIDGLLSVPIEKIELEAKVDLTKRREGIPLTVKLLQKLNSSRTPLEAREMLDVASEKQASALSATLTKMRDGGFIHSVMMKDNRQRGRYNIYTITPKGRTWLERYGKPDA